MKKKILVVVSLLIVVAMLTTGAFAYFTKTRTAAAGQITAGTLNIQLASNANSGIRPDVWADTVAPPWNLATVAPGDEVFGCLWVKNMGNIDSVGVEWDFKSLVNSLSGVKLEDRMQIIDLYTTDTVTAGYDWPADLLVGGDYYRGGFYDENSDGKISLGELSRWSDRTPPDFDWENDNPGLHFLLGNIGPQSEGYICMNLKMMNGTPADDNPFQGDGLTYDVLVTAKNPAQ